MNRIRTILWLGSLGLLLATTPSCDPLDQEPPAALTADETFSTPDRIGKAAVGMYDGLQNAEFLGGRALIYSDLRSDDVNQSPFFPDISANNALANNGQVTAAWTGAYRTIFQANFFMQRLAANPGKVSAALENQYMGEGKFIRALTYFHLVNLYAQPYNFTPTATHLGVPLQLTAPNDATEALSAAQQLPRATVAQVYDRIERDLRDAVLGLPEGITTNRATKDAARALLSRVALYKGDYAAAAAAAADVVASGRHTLNASPATVFNLNSYSTTESVFSIAMNASDNPNTNNALGQHYGRGGRADITVTPYAQIPVAQFPLSDLRRTQLLDLPTLPAAASTFTLKYNNRSFDFVPIVRYSEVLLNQAEGLAQTDAGVSTAAVALLNQVRDRSKPTSAPSYAAIDFADKPALIEAILLERRLELAFEGHRYYDLLRYRRNSLRINYGDPRGILPIPLVDVQQNPNLVQNPGY